MARLSAAILALAVAQTANAASPADPAVPASLELRADAACAARQDIVASVRRRSARIQFVTDEHDATRFRASIRAASKDEFIAELTVVQASGRHSSRRLRVGSCEEGVDALALVIVMTLDPESATLDAASRASGESARDGRNARDGGSAASSSDASSPDAAGERASSSSTPAASGGANGGAAAANANPKPASPGAADQDGGADARTAASPPGFSPHTDLLLGLSAQGISGPAPSFMPGFGGAIAWAVERDALFSPAARLGIGYEWVSELEEAGGNADFSLLFAGLDLCPVALRPLGAVSVRPCAFAAAGRLAASGSNTLDPRSESRPFAAVGASLLAGIELGQRLQLSGNASIGRNLVEDTFAFRPNVFYRVPALSLLFALGVSYRFSVIE